MAETTTEAKFKVTVDGNADESMKNVSRSAQGAKKAIDDYREQIKDASRSLRDLKGSSVEVKAQKAKLYDVVKKARAGIAEETAALLKQGSSYEKAAAAAKKYGKAVGAVDAFKGAGSDFKSGLKGMFGGAGGAIKGAAGKAFGLVGKQIAGAFGKVGKKIGPSLAPAKKAIGALAGPAKKVAAKLGPFASGIGKTFKGMGSAAKAAAPVVSKGLMLVGGAYAAAAAAAVAAAGAVVAFGMKAATAAAQMQRHRQALLGNAKDASALGDQIQALAAKVPQGVEELNELALSLSKTRLSGKGIVNTMNAVAQATAGVDAEAGQKIQELITRNHRMGRMAIGRFELEGTGIDFDEVAKEYAKGTKMTVAAAAAELRSGRASIEKGSEALANVTKNKFGAANLEEAFSLDNAPKKFFDQVSSLAKGMNLKPITEGLQKAFAQLSPDAPLGKAIKTLFETVGSDVAKLAGDAIPMLVNGFKRLLIMGIEAATWFYNFKADIKEAFAAKDWEKLGKAILEGLWRGIKSSMFLPIKAVEGVASLVKDAFAGPKGIDAHSPSRWASKQGSNFTDGIVQGIDRGTRKASAASASMTDAVKGEASGASVGASGDTTTTNTSRIGSIVVNIHGAPTGDAQAMQSPDFLSGLTRAIRDAVTVQGVEA